MFVPSKKLLWLTGLIITPAMFALGVGGASMQTMLLLAGLLLAVVLLDAFSSLRRLSSVVVALPDSVRTSKSKCFQLPVTATDLSASCKQVLMGLALPRQLDSAEWIISLKLADADKPAQGCWELLALERGIMKIDAVYLETPSWLGLWDMRREQSVNCEIRVYPDLSRERNVLAPLFFRRGNIGMHQVRQVGKGREFEQLRNYVPGDSYNDIYWKGTAKRRLPVTMTYQIERTQELHVVLDCSRRSARPLEAMKRGMKPEDERFSPKNQCERFIQAALVLALAAEQQGDRFGMMVFSDQVHSVLSASGGRGHYNACRDILYTLQPQVVSPDFGELFSQIGNRIRQRALIIILTDLAEPWLSESFIQTCTQAARRHVVVVHTLGSAEFQPLFGRHSDISHADELYSKLAGHLIWSELQGVSRLLKQSKVHLTTSTQENLIADVVTSYLNIKKRQLI